MTISTSSGSVFKYLRRTNEILGEDTSVRPFYWLFEPLKRFGSLPDVKMYILGITEQCNLRCKYCCYSGKYKLNRIHGSKNMDFTDIESIFDFIQNFSKNPPERIAFYGGEPLLQYELVQKAISCAQTLWRNITFPITTNGTLLTPERIDWLIAHDVELTISIDGAQQHNDINRVYASGKGSFYQIKRSIEYIKSKHPNYLAKLSLQMTLDDFSNLDEIAKAWNEDDILYDIAPTNIHGVASNFDLSVNKVEYNSVRNLYLRLLNTFAENPNLLVLKTFFEQIADNWGNRPILEVPSEAPMATCLPVNTKLFIDTDLNIGVCEKMSDNFRIGSIKDGICWEAANKIVSDYYNRRVNRCKECEAVRFCKMCLTALEHQESNWDILCHNERIYTQASMFVFCEMAERGMIE